MLHLIANASTIAINAPVGTASEYVHPALGRENGFVISVVHDGSLLFALGIIITYKYDNVTSYLRFYKIKIIAHQNLKTDERFICFEKYFGLG